MVRTGRHLGDIGRDVIDVGESDPAESDQILGHRGRREGGAKNSDERTMEGVGVTGWRHAETLGGVGGGETRSRHTSLSR